MDDYDDCADGRTLADDGFRFLQSNGVFAWVHPAAVPVYIQRGAVDTTDMDDAAFEAYARQVFAMQAHVDGETIRIEGNCHIAWDAYAQREVRTYPIANSK